MALGTARLGRLLERRLPVEHFGASKIGPHTLKSLALFRCLLRSHREWRVTISRQEYGGYCAGWEAGNGSSRHIIPDSAAEVPLGWRRRSVNAQPGRQGQPRRIGLS